jgi:hypothetical protein
MKPQFDYVTFTARSIGFLTADEPARRCQSCVFVCGVGSTSGAAFVDLLRAGLVRPTPQPESPNDPPWGKPWDAGTEKDKPRRGAQREHVMTHLSSRHCVDLQIATGMLMVGEKISNLLEETTRTNCRAWFFNRSRPSVGGSSPSAIAALARPIDWPRFSRRVSS